MVEIFDNIHQLYQYQAPCAELADYIEFFSESSPTATRQHVADKPFNVRLFSSWTPTFWFNLGSPYQLLIGEKYFSVGSSDDILLLRSTTVERCNLPTDHIFTVKFSPGGLEAIFDIKQGCIEDKLVHLSDIVPSQWVQKFKQIDNFEERVILLQHYFLGLLKQSAHRDHYFRVVKRAIETYHISNMEFNSTQIAREVFATNKTIYRYFNQVIGTNPKNYFSNVRVRTALQNYVSDKAAFSPYDFGYYDMSHFYKDVVKFTGQKLIDNLV